MPDMLKNLQEQAKQFWDGLSKSNRIKLVVVSSLVFLSVVATIFLITRPHYVRLLAEPVDQKTASEITKTLDSSGIEWQLEQDGTVILVKENDKDTAALAVADKGLIKRGMSFEDFSASGLGTTEKDKDRKYLLYQETEIALALEEGIDSVSRADVKFTMPDKAPFGDPNAAKPTASVILTLENGLNQNQVEGIRRFVAGSIERLDANDVTIIDSDGRMLTESGDTGIDQNVDKQFELKRKQTDQMKNAVYNILSGMCSQVEVVPSLEFDFDNKVTERRTFAPPIEGEDAGMVRSAETIRESMDNMPETGAPGTVTNQTGPQYSGNGGESSSYNREETRSNYEMNEEYTSTQSELGRVVKENSSIAITMSYTNRENIILPEDAKERNIVDVKKVSSKPSEQFYLAGAQNPGDPNAVTSATGLTTNNQNEEDRIKDLVSKSTGIPVENIHIAMVELPIIYDYTSGINTGELAAMYGPFLLALIILALLFMAIFRKSRTVEGEEEEMEEEEAAVGYANPRRQEDIAEIDTEERSQIKKQIDKFVQQKPDAVAQLLRNWLAEEWE